MLKTLFLLTFSLLLSANAEYIWSQDTKTMSQEKSDTIIQAFKNGDPSDLIFKDDPKRQKMISEFEENLMVFGLSLGSSSYTEEISNTQGSYSNNYSSYDLTFTLAKDFTLWHEEYTQPSRIYFSYALTKANEELDFSTWTLGLRENMFYWPLYKTSTYSIYPTASFEVGSSSIQRGSSSMQSLTTALQAGLTYTRYGNFEYFLNLSGDSIKWKHPIDGIADEMIGLGVKFGINYKLMYGDFE